MNYIKPEDIKEYVSKNPRGIAGMSEELTTMVNHFAELIVRDCAGIYNKLDNGNQHLGTDDYLEALQKHFGVK
jgi:hypothetical protein